MDKDPTVIVFALIALTATFGILGYLVSGITRRIQYNGFDEHQGSVKEFLKNDNPSKSAAGKSGG